MDFLSATINKSISAVVQAKTEFIDVGKAVAGFKGSERRRCMGGELWRRFDPHQKSKLFGDDYESWEASGYPSVWFAEVLRSCSPVRPSRVDVAFDFDCAEDFLADDVIPHVRAHAEAAGIEIGISGSGTRNTRYIGAPLSDRRIRIYRRDFKDKTLGVLLGPVLRIELVLRRERAHAWWPVWAEDTEAAFELAAGHVFEMSGLRLAEVMRDVPPLDLPECRDEAERVQQCLRMYGDLISEWVGAGVPFVELCQEHAKRSKSRMALKRQREVRASLHHSDVEDLVSIVRRLEAVAA